MINVDISEHAHADHNEFMRLHARALQLISEVPSLEELERALQEEKYRVGHQERRGGKELIVFALNGNSLASIILQELTHPVVA
ncbi:MAG: hypothetical protein A2804_00795 [Candidatus Pacebacteria bacterium RIFCSPHIGHO2_01_FULL_46_10]|nr:MAG: hypothetical protein A2804_00795 [Candidatus Pacebacteria bacterium RIFCSPHIGHO2_01_FULL_46_10]